jgi:histone-lysine N-methyltransferase ASH1L
MNLNQNIVQEYNCFNCHERPFNQEILLKTQPKDALSGLTYFYTLLRDDLQVKIGECFYVMKDRENLISFEGKVRKIPKKVLDSLDPIDCDILRVEHLWINEK